MDKEPALTKYNLLSKIRDLLIKGLTTEELNRIMTIDVKRTHEETIEIERQREAYMFDRKKINDAIEDNSRIVLAAERERVNEQSTKDVLSLLHYIKATNLSPERVELYKKNEFIVSIAENLAKWSKLSDKQIASVSKAMVRDVKAQ